MFIAKWLIFKPLQFPFKNLKTFTKSFIVFYYFLGR